MSQQGAGPGEAPDPSDQTANLRLGHIFRAVDGWLERLGVERGGPDPMSSLGADDRRTAGYELSHIVTTLLVSSIDHVHTLRSLIVDAKVLHRSAPTVIRPAIENSCTAIWLLSPARRKERVIRRFQLQWADFRDAERMNRCLGSADTTWLAERKEKLRVKAVAAGLDEAEQTRIFKENVGYGKIVQLAADNILNFDPTVVVASWMACSGFSHGRVWATLSLNQVDEVRRSESGPDLSARISASEEFVERITLTAAALIENVWRLWDQRTFHY